MPMFETTFRYRHNCPFNNLSRRYPTVMFSVWDNYYREFMEVRCDDKDASKALDQDIKDFIRRKGSKLLHRSEDRRGTKMLTVTCACDPEKSSTKPIVENGCMLVPPITFYDGWENYRIVGFEKKDVLRALDGMESRGVVEITSRKSIDIDSMREFYLISLAELFSNMTKLQMDALVTAMESGYYKIPRRSTTSEMARILKVPRTSLQERRKRAESKLMAALVPYALTYSRNSLL
jgi:predicted DNA binding protein